MSSLSAGDEEPSAAEWTAVAVSVAVTVLLFGYVAWHATTVPADAVPEATVTWTETAEDGRVVVTVEVYNPGGRGLESVTVSADCANGSLTFEHVPVDDRRTGTLVCPAGTEDPSASVVGWVQA